MANGAMSPDDLLNIVLAGGTGKLNTEFRSMKSSLFNHFMMKENVQKADGAGYQYDVVVEGENVRAYKAGSIWPTNQRNILNQWTIPYFNVYAGVTFEGTEISQQLGGYSIEDFMSGSAPRASFPTLINVMEAHLQNVKESFLLNQSDALYNKKIEEDGAENIDGFDIIFAQNTNYGGKSHTALGQHDWTSAVTGTAPYRHNPIHLDVSATSTSGIGVGTAGQLEIFKHLNAVCTDISRGRANISSAGDNEKIKIMAVTDPMTFGLFDEAFDVQVRRQGSEQHSSTIGITEPITWPRWGLEIHADHYCPEGEMFIWADEHIKKICQTGPRGDFSLRRVRLAFAQDTIHVPWTVEYNLGCSARWQCAKVEGIDTVVAKAA